MKKLVIYATIMLICAGIAVAYYLSGIAVNSPASVTNDSQNAANDSVVQDVEIPVSPKDCENASQRDFCLDDAAEMNNNISACYGIADPDVRVFCTARISLNETLCAQVSDEGLKKACIESILLKLAWGSGNQ
jgi:hypothetical protein